MVGSSEVSRALPVRHFEFESASQAEKPSLRSRTLHEITGRRRHRRFLESSEDTPYRTPGVSESPDDKAFVMLSDFSARQTARNIVVYSPKV
ncbi:hypothetical protein KM043_010536 [Ampulex compressa]|nr:hypothetical protein KM043_010536 [Ampulex compressa]